MAIIFAHMSLIVAFVVSVHPNSARITSIVIIPFSQWIGFVGKILTGNHRFSHETWGFPEFSCKLSLRPIHWPNPKSLFQVDDEAGQSSEATSRSHDEFLGRYEWLFILVASLPDMRSLDIYHRIYYVYIWDCMGVCI